MFYFIQKVFSSITVDNIYFAVHARKGNTFATSTKHVRILILNTIRMLTNESRSEQGIMLVRKMSS
jgi:hypothetical protein